MGTRYPHSAAATIREEYYFDAPLPNGTKVLVAELVMEATSTPRKIRRLI